LLLLPLLGWHCTADDVPHLETQKVEIKQMDQNSLSAKQKALAEASRSAFQKLVTTKLGKDPKIFEKISDDQIQECIHDYSIENEKYSDSFYIAELAYRFSTKKVSDLMESFGLDLGYTPESTPSKTVKIAVYADDFLQHAGKLGELGKTVQFFSHKKVIFTIDEKNINAFRQLCIQYARLP
jgi:hypothetical protein